MSITIAARYDGHALVPEHPLDLPIGQLVTLEVAEVAEEDSPTTQLWRAIQNDPDLASQIVYANGLLNVCGTRNTVSLILQLSEAGIEAGAIHDRLPTANVCAIEHLIAFAKRQAETVRNYLDAQRETEVASFDFAHRAPPVEQLRARTMAPIACSSSADEWADTYRFIP